MKAFSAPRGAKSTRPVGAERREFAIANEATILIALGLYKVMLGTRSGNVLPPIRATDFVFQSGATNGGLNFVLSAWRERVKTLPNQKREDFL